MKAAITLKYSQIPTQELRAREQQHFSEKDVKRQQQLQAKANELDEIAENTRKSETQNQVMNTLKWIFFFAENWEEKKWSRN